MIPVKSGSFIKEKAFPLPGKSEIIKIERYDKGNIFAVGGKFFLSLYELDKENNFFKKVSLSTKKETLSKSPYIKWQPGEKKLAFSGPDVPNIYIWDTEKDNFLEKCNKKKADCALVSSLCWNKKNNKELAYCSSSEKIKIISYGESEKPIKELHTTYKPCDCQFNPMNGNYLLSADVMGSIKLWDLRNENLPLYIYKNHENKDISIDWHPYLEDYFISCGADANMFLWNVKERDPLLKIKESGSISNIKFLPTKPEYVYTYSIKSRKIHLWNLGIKNYPEYSYLSSNLENIRDVCIDIENERFIICNPKEICTNYLKDGLRIYDTITMGSNLITKDGKLLFSQEEEIPESEFFIKLKKKDSKEYYNYKENDSKTIMKNPADNDFYGNLTDKIEKKIVPSISSEHSTKEYFNALDNIKETNEVEYIFKNHELTKYCKYLSEEINEMFIKYYCFTGNRKNYFKNDDITSPGETLSQQINKIIEKNTDIAVNYMKNELHITILKQLNEMIKQKSFKIIDNINNKLNDDEKLYLEIFKGNVSVIIEYLIEKVGDLYFSVIISHIFHDLFVTDKNLKLRMFKIESDCISNLRDYKLYFLSTFFEKYGYCKEINKPTKSRELIIQCRDCKDIFGKNNLNCKCGKFLDNCSKCFRWCPECGIVERLNLEKK